MSESCAFEVLRRIGNSLQQGPLSVVGQDLIDTIEGGLGYQYCALLIAGPTGALRPLALSRQGRDEQFLESDKRYVEDCCRLAGSGLTGWVATHGKSVRLDDVRRDTRYASVRDHIRSELCVPLINDGAAFGVLNTETPRTCAYQPADQNLLETVAAEIALSVRTHPDIGPEQKESHGALVLEKCMYCGDVRVPHAGWTVDLETSALHSAERVSHGVCPRCVPRLTRDLSDN